MAAWTLELLALSHFQQVSSCSVAPHVSKVQNKMIDEEIDDPKPEVESHFSFGYKRHFENSASSGELHLFLEKDKWECSKFISIIPILVRRTKSTESRVIAVGVE